MAGIYIHIPFCKQACYYCDFHFSTSAKYLHDMVNAISVELNLQKSFFDPSTVINTIYFGGGTPSLLTIDEILKIIDAVYKNYSVSPTAEITLEANPDDLTPVKVKQLKTTNVNRLSIGIQSFVEQELKWMNRAHNVLQADYCVKALQDAGLTNITIDLIYGLPDQSNQNWLYSMQQAFNLQVPHLSCYCLTVEEKTALHHLIKTKKYNNINDEIAKTHFQLLLEKTEENNFLQYEISNFAKPGFESKHNSNYWKGIPYLGIGPSAHSFKENSRRENVKSNALYLEHILNKNRLHYKEEILTKRDLFNEYIMTNLRTSWGCDLQRIENDFGNELSTFVLEAADPYLKNKSLTLKENILYLTKDGKLYADKIASDLFILEKL